MSSSRAKPIERIKIMATVQNKLGQVVLKATCSYLGPDKNQNSHGKIVAVFSFQVISGQFPRVNKKDLNVFPEQWASKELFKSFTNSGSARVGKTYLLKGEAYSYLRKNGTLDFALEQVSPA